ncbi:MAG: polysaccharide biosynthesis C-terminal domain-containing protein, partial [Candidatus Wildermuthbacteria bacterium]|nr:polysaccharide biosynthesis C-terminal domain-containing protein [Candidatus Wildermuthbacteria bacterium]
VSFIGILAWFHLRVEPVGWAWNMKIWRKFISISWPLAFTALATSLYTYGDSILMGIWGQITQTGWYNGAHKIASTALLPAILLSQGFYPPLSASVRGFKGLFNSIWNKHFGVMVALALPICMGGIVLAPKIIGFMYGQDYMPSVPTFQILMIMAGITMLYLPFKYALIADDQQKNVLVITTIGAAINIFLNVLLIPRFSLNGAAVASLGAHGVILIASSFIFFRRQSDLFLARDNVKLSGISLLAASCMALILYWSSAAMLHVVFAIMLGFFVYGTLFALLYTIIMRKKKEI